jgi:hypothetical protein
LSSQKFKRDLQIYCKGDLGPVRVKKIERKSFFAKATEDTTLARAMVVKAGSLKL